MPPFSRSRHDPRKGEPSWIWRRLFAWVLMGFAVWRLMSLESAADTRVNETMAWGWVFLLISLSLGYMGFAAAQDIAAIVTTRSGTPYALPPRARARSDEDDAPLSPPPGYAS